MPDASQPGRVTLRGTLGTATQSGGGAARSKIEVPRAWLIVHAEHTCMHLHAFDVLSTHEPLCIMGCCVPVRSWDWCEYR